MIVAQDFYASFSSFAANMNWPIFKYLINFLILGLSKYGFLGQLTQKWQVFKVLSAKQRMFYCDLYSKMNIFLMPFSHFKLCHTATFEPVDLRTGYLHLLESLKVEKLTQYVKMMVEDENIWPTLYKSKSP